MKQRPKYKRSVKLLEEEIEINLYDLRFGNGLTDVTLKAWKTKEKIDKLHFIKVKIFVFQRTLSRQWKGWERNICKSNVWWKRYIYI